MKKIIIALVVTLFISVSSHAQQGINYKALLKDSNDNVLANTFMSVQFSIHENSTTGTIIYQEDHNYTTDTNGLVILNIGTDATPNIGVFGDINWSANQHFLQTTITYNGGIINFDATEFMAVPYAKHAETAANIFSGDYNDLTNQPTITVPSGLERITESTDTDTGEPIYGWRLIGQNSAFYGNLGENAVDLSYSGYNSTTRGATGRYSFASGHSNTASGIASTALGNGNIASGDFSSALGYFSKSVGEYSTAIGYDSESKGHHSTAIGPSSQTSSYGEIALGLFNTTYTPNSESEWNSNDRLFVIGNGYWQGTYHRSDALIVLKNGTITAPSFDISQITDDKALVTKEYADTNYLNADGPLTIQNATDATSTWRLETRPNGSLSLYRNGDYRGFFSESTGNYSSISDRRTKKDITAIENGTLHKVMQLNPVSYLMKDQTDTKRNLGLISQEVQEIFPSITTYVEESDLITLSYTELIPILIKALQEQQGVINTQNSKIETLSTDNSTLENMVNNLISRVEKIETNNQ
ncbi:tail fiber domain-containing protein [Winogradskyella psychrotolerans]|uniref:tail fiber domain-containing protein n=1 Tax=Winogradskyella psychrotolerans TaxID=1344585 RepID=UPI001C06E0B5|nr:tail fiber domain-containing protein [Winogradskyella psychrotolerans]MBU2930139.1 tail fiber domain-containing protein [Winogradskyella psychrotolerans]